MQNSINKQKKEAKDAVNISRNKKSDLAKEFQEFKQRIQEFEDKNEEIINRIRQTYSFKKKTIESRNLNPQIPVENYQRNRPYNDLQSDNSSCDLSQKIVYDGNVINHGAKYRKHQPQFHNQQHYNANYRHWEDQNMQLPKFQKPINSTEQFPKRAIHYKQYMRNMNGHKAMTEYEQMQQIEPHYRNYEANQRTGNFFNEETIQQLENRLQEVLSKNSMLQSELQAKDEEINRVKSIEPKLKGYMSNAKKVISESFQTFQQDIIVPRLDEIEKYIKKCINRMKNLVMKVKDQMEERQSHRTIQRSRSRRRFSSKQKEPNSSASSADIKESSVSGPRDLPKPFGPRALSNQKIQNSHNKSEITSKQKQFQHIASEYEKMIKSKVHQIEQLQNKLKQEIFSKEKLANEVKRCNKLLDQKCELLKNASTTKKPTREEQNQTKQLKELRERVVNLEQVLRQKQDRQKQLQGSMLKLQRSKKMLFEQQKESYNKSLTKKNENINQLQDKLKKIENDHFKQLNQLKQKLFVGQKYNLEKDVQLMGLANKLKKIEADVLLKDQKLKQLEKLILKQNDQTQLLQKSMSMDNSLISPADLKNMQQSLRKLQEQLEQKASNIYELQRQKQRQSIEIESYWQTNEKMAKNVELLQRKIKQMSKQAQNRMLQISEKQSARQFQQKQMLFQELQEEHKELIEEKQQLLLKNKSLLQDLKKLKQENLGYNREIIKLNSQIAFNKDEFQTLRVKHAKIKEEITEGKSKIGELQSKLQEKQNFYIYETKSLQNQIINLTSQILQLQNFNKGEDKIEENLLNSLHGSDVSFSMNNKRYPEEEINALKERIKQLQTQLEMKQLIELQMQNEYKSNLQKIRSESADKNKELQSYINDIDQLKKQLKTAHQQKQDKVQIENYRISMYKETIIQLQSQYNTSRQGQQRLNQLLHSLMQNMKQKSEEMNRLTQELEFKDKALQELKQLLDLKGTNKGKDQSKQLILRISGEGSQQISDIAEISYMSNISDVFKRDDVLQQKMRKGKTSRQEFVKLFTKTSAYIKTLKKLIQNKDKRIKTLEKQIQSFKTQENRSWCPSNQKEKAAFHFSKTEFFLSKDDESLEQYKDYQSMQIDTRRTKSYEQIKELQREKELAVQENKMLVHQIDALQEQLMKAEQQENSLVKIKDLYKEEIKKLMEKNQAHNKEFQVQINKMKHQLQATLNFHNWQALKQLLSKIIGSFSALQDVSQKAKRQQRKKQLQDYFKVMSCVLGLEITPRQRGNSGKK